MYEIHLLVICMALALHCVEFQKHFRGSNIPLLIMASKCEMSRVTQNYDVTPEEFCKANSLSPPQYFNSVDLGSKDLYSTLATMAAHP